MPTSVAEALDETHGPQALRLTMKQRQEKLFKELDVSGLESWPPELADSAWSLLAKTMTSSHWSPVSLAVPIQLNM